MADQMPVFAPDLQPLEIGMLIYPGMTLLDLAGPQSALGMHGRTHLFWKTLEPVMTDSGVAMLPTATFADVLQKLGVMFVPGGFGTVEAMKDGVILAFLASRRRAARHVTSVCAGSLILGRARLLDGHRAATHWACYRGLDALGVDAEHRRVVADRNRLTGGGVTAGIDFGLTLLADLRGQDVAKIAQLMMECDPVPPFDTGRPERAGRELVSAARVSMGESRAEAVEIARSRRERTREPV